MGYSSGPGQIAYASCFGCLSGPLMYLEIVLKNMTSYRNILSIFSLVEECYLFCVLISFLTFTYCITGNFCSVKFLRFWSKKKTFNFCRFFFLWIVKNSIYSNGDLWPNDPKINMILSLPQGNHVAKFVKDPIYRTKVIGRKRPCCQKFYL